MFHINIKQYLIEVWKLLETKKNAAKPEELETRKIRG